MKKLHKKQRNKLPKKILGFIHIKKYLIFEDIYMKEELLELTGVVTDKLPNAMFKVKLENGVEILAHTAGKMRKFRIRVMVGDKVDIEMTPYDLTKGRITFRHKD